MNFAVSPALGYSDSGKEEDEQRGLSTSYRLFGLVE